MDYLYIDENRMVHEVRIHHFGRDINYVRVIGSIKLNPTDAIYPDKKWVKTSDLYVKASFTEEFIKTHSF